MQLQYEAKTKQYSLIEKNDMEMGSSVFLANNF